MSPSSGTRRKRRSEARRPFGIWQSQIDDLISVIDELMIDGLGNLAIGVKQR
jgi:hypothetical protein